MSLLFFAFSRDALQKALINRVAQCILTCPTTGVLQRPRRRSRQAHQDRGSLRFFGDGWQISKRLDGVRYWRIPTMDGEFLCQDVFGTVKGVAGGNFLVLGATQAVALQCHGGSRRRDPRTVPERDHAVSLAASCGPAARLAASTRRLKASTNDAYCPTLRGQVATKLPAGVNAVYEVVIDGLDLEFGREGHEGRRSGPRVGRASWASRPAITAARSAPITYIYTRRSRRLDRCRYCQPPPFGC